MTLGERKGRARNILRIINRRRNTQIDRHPGKPTESVLRFRRQLRCYTRYDIMLCIGWRRRKEGFEGEGVEEGALLVGG